MHHPPCGEHLRQCRQRAADAKTRDSVCLGQKTDKEHGRRHVHHDADDGADHAVRLIAVGGHDQLEQGTQAEKQDHQARSLYVQPSHGHSLGRRLRPAGDRQHAARPKDADRKKDKIHKEGKDQRQREDAPVIVHIASAHRAKQLEEASLEDHADKGEHQTDDRHTQGDSRHSVGAEVMARDNGVYHERHGLYQRVHHARWHDLSDRTRR